MVLLLLLLLLLPAVTVQQLLQRLLVWPPPLLLLLLLLPLTLLLLPLMLMLPFLLLPLLSLARPSRVDCLARPGLCMQAQGWSSATVNVRTQEAVEVLAVCLYHRACRRGALVRDG